MLNQLSNTDLRKALTYWARSEQIERYRVPVFSDRFKNGLWWMLIGAFCGFVWGILVAGMIGGG